MYYLSLLFLVLCITSCSEDRSAHKKWWQRAHYEKEWVSAAATLDPVPTPPQIRPSPKYSWENYLEGSLAPITKEHFRCKGCHLNPVRSAEKGGAKSERLHDCGGTDRHSLPIREGKEFIYPILIDLLNHIQSKTQKRVIVTSGHRCPDHNTYIDESLSNRYSKHQIGAEVSFYVEGLENSPAAVIQIIQDFYANQPDELQHFTRYTKEDTNVSTSPWMNQEIFVKLFKTDEGRNLDNRHPFPYIAIQVRMDLQSQERVTYSWDKAFHNFHRY